MIKNAFNIYRHKKDEHFVLLYLLYLSDSTYHRPSFPEYMFVLCPFFLNLLPAD